MTKTHYHPSLLFSDQQHVKGACGLRGRCPLLAVSAERPRIWMNIKYEFQLSLRHRSLPQQCPRCSYPQFCLGFLDRLWVRSVAVSGPGLPGLPASRSHLASPHTTPWPACWWAMWVKHCYHHTSHTPETAFYPGFSLSVGQKV